MKNLDAYILVGCPAAGKSTWVAQHVTPTTTVLSTDNFIEDRAAQLGKTYSEIFAETIKDAEKNLEKDLQAAIANSRHIIWDQTNLNAKIRHKKLIKIPAWYNKIAVVFATPEPEEHQRRLNCRPGKLIPQAVIQNMIHSMQLPELAEGFDSIFYI